MAYTNKKLRISLDQATDRDGDKNGPGGFYKLPSEVGSSSTVGTSTTAEYASSIIADSTTIPKFGHKRASSLNSKSSYSYSLRPSLDEGSNYSFGLNTLQTTPFSPLGPNPIFQILNGDNQNDPFRSPQMSPMTSSSLASSSSPRQKRGSVSSNPPVPTSSSVHHRNPTTKEITPVELPKIRRVKKTEVMGYLSSISDEYSKYQAMKKAAGAFVSSRDDSSDTSSVKDSASVISEGTTSNLLWKSLSSLQTSIPSLDNVPSVFFEEPFSLDNPRTFDIVSERADIVRQSNNNTPNISTLSSPGYSVPDGLGIPPDGLLSPTSPSSSRKVLANNTILQEKLSWYLDTVEIHLVNEISNASDSFFSALSDLHAIDTNAYKCIEKLDRFKFFLEDVDRLQATKGIEMLKLIKKRSKVEKMEQVLVQIDIILNESKKINVFFNEKKLKNCLKQIDSVEALISGDLSNNFVKQITKDWPTPVSDLRSAKALTVLREQLRVSRNDVGGNYMTVFNDRLLKDLRDHYNLIPETDTIKRMARILEAPSARKDEPVNNSFQNVTKSFREELLELLDALYKCQEIMTGFKSYEALILKEVKGLTKVGLPIDDATSMNSGISSGSNRSTVDRTTDLANLLKAQTPREFEDMLIFIYTKLSETFRRLSIQQRLLLDLALTAAEANANRPNQDDDFDIVHVDIRLTINKGISATQRRMSKVINTRKDQNFSLPFEFFMRFYFMTGLFLSECEAISGTMGNDLHNVLIGHMKQYPNQFHLNNMKYFMIRVEKDQWRDVNITQLLQDTVDEIVQSSIQDPEKWTGRSYLSGMKTGGSSNNSEDKDNVIGKRINVNEFQTCAISSTTAELIGLIRQYLILTITFTQSADSIISLLLEILRSFNSRVHDLVLGAQATQYAGLKHITARHLAVSSQSLDLIINLIPHVRECYRRHYGGSNEPERDIRKSALAEFDKTRRLYQDHQNEIYSKLINIMGDRIKAHCVDISKIDWSAPLPEGKQCHQYMEALAKETSTLSKVLGKYLSEPQALVC